MASGKNARLGAAGNRDSRRRRSCADAGAIAATAEKCELRRPGFGEVRGEQRSLPALRVTDDHETSRDCFLSNRPVSIVNGASCSDDGQHSAPFRGPEEVRVRAASARPRIVGHHDDPASVEELVQQHMGGRVDLAVNRHRRVGRVTHVCQLFRVQRGSTAICDTDSPVRPTHDRPTTRWRVSLRHCNDSRDTYRRSIRDARGLVDHKLASCGGLQCGRSRYRAHTNDVTMLAH